MKREDKVISLGLAKEIDLWSAEKDVAPTVSQYYWVRNKADSFFFLQEGVKPLDKKYYPAYDTAELGEMVGNQSYIVSGKYDGSLYICKLDRAVVSLKDDALIQRMFEEETEFVETTEAEARGRLYLWLLKEGYING